MRHLIFSMLSRWLACYLAIWLASGWIEGWMGGCGFFDLTIVFI